MVFKIPKVCIYLSSTKHDSQHLTHRDIGKLFWHNDIPDVGILSQKIYELKNIQSDGSLVLQKIQRLCMCHWLEDMADSLGSSDLTIPACKNDGLWNEVAIQGHGDKEEINWNIYDDLETFETISSSYHYDYPLKEGRAISNAGRSLTSDDIGNAFYPTAQVREEFFYVGEKDKFILKEITPSHFCFEWLAKVGDEYHNLLLEDHSLKLMRSKYDVPEWVPFEEYLENVLPGSAMNTGMTSPRFSPFQIWHFPMRHSEDPVYRGMQFEEYLESQQHRSDRKSCWVKTAYAELKNLSCSPFEIWYSQKQHSADPVYRGIQYPVKESSDEQAYTPNLQSDDPYEILGLPVNCSKKMVKKQYRKLARRFHPDKNRNSSLEVEEFFKKIQCAFDELTSSPHTNHADLNPSYPKYRALPIAMRAYNRLLREFLDSDASEYRKYIDEFGLIAKYLENYRPFHESEQEWLKTDHVSHSYCSCLKVQSQLDEMPIPGCVEDIQYQLGQLDTLQSSEDYSAVIELKEDYPMIFRETSLVFYNKKVGLLRMLCEYKILEIDKAAIQEVYQDAMKTIDHYERATEDYHELQNQYIMKCEQNTKKETDKKETPFHFSHTEDKIATQKDRPCESSSKLGPPMVYSKRSEKEKSAFTRSDYMEQVEENLKENIEYFKK